jgi:transcriptional regulator with XRE-family HTH domain
VACAKEGPAECLADVAGANDRDLHRSFFLGVSQQGFLQDNYASLICSCQYGLCQGIFWRMTDAATPETPVRRRPRVGPQIHRRRRELGLTLAQVSQATSLNVGYLSQLENDKASPSLETLAALADTLDVPIAWLLIEQSVAPRVMRQADRPRRRMPRMAGSMTRVDGGISRSIAIFEGLMPPGARTGGHEHPGDEHHLILSGRVRITQGDTVVEAGPGDYVLLDGTLPHDAETLGAEED